MTSRKIVYLDNFPAENAHEILAGRPDILVERITSDMDPDQAFDILRTAHAFQQQPARDEVPPHLLVTRELLDRCPNLLIASSGGSGCDTIDIPACTERGVMVVNQAGGNAEAVAEHALGMILLLLKRVPEADRKLRRGYEGTRSQLIGRNLYGRTVGIVGLGYVGSRMARLLRHSFDCRVLAHDPYLTDAQFAERNAVSASMQDVLTESDVVTVHVPLNDETRGMFAAPQFEAMRKNAIFITTARGEIHDEDALDQSLRSGHLGGAGLDVWASEPPSANHPLMDHDNVVVSPHTAGVTVDSRAYMAEYAATQLIEMLDGKPATRPVNPEAESDYIRNFRRIIGKAELIS